MCQVVAPQKVVAVAYERRSFTRYSNYRALTGKNLAFWIGRRLREVVAHRGSTVWLSFFVLFRGEGQAGF